MISSINDILAQASEAAGAEHQREVQTLQDQHRQCEKEHRQAVKKIETELGVSRADQLRMSHNITTLLDDAKKDAALEVDAANAKLREAVAAAAAVQAQADKAVVLEQLQGQYTLSAIAEKLLADDSDKERASSIKSIDSIGSNGSVGQRRMADAAWVMGKCITAVLEATQLDATDVLAAVADRLAPTLTIPPHHRPTASPPHHTIPSLHHLTTSPTHHSIAPPSHHPTTPPLHHLTTPPPHYPTIPLPRHTTPPGATTTLTQQGGRYMSSEIAMALPVQQRKC